MIVMVGLGNIGENYKLTKHNIGFMIVDYLAQHLDFPTFTDKGSYWLTSLSIEGKRFFLLKPKTFMNLSGSAVLSFASFYKISPESIVVVQDDLDMEFGKIKYKTNSGDGGHNGIKDIHNKIGKGIQRIKIGIGRPLIPQFDISSYVLSKFNNNEIDQIQLIAELFAENITALVQKDCKYFVQSINNSSI